MTAATWYPHQSHHPPYVNEPTTAAAIANGLDENSPGADGSHIIVYDLGGEAIVVSLRSIDNCVCEDGNNCSETITHAKFEELDLYLSRKTLKPVEQVLKDASMKREDIEDVLLVGGSTPMTRLPSSAIPSSRTTSATATTATRVRLSGTRTHKPSGVFGYAMLSKRFEHPFHSFPQAIKRRVRLLKRPTEASPVVHLQN
ncbi:ATPase with role in protein import into the ER, partial [Tulasnella sp. 417]